MGQEGGRGGEDGGKIEWNSSEINTPCYPYFPFHMVSLLLYSHRFATMIPKLKIKIRERRGKTLTKN